MATETRIIISAKDMASPAFRQVSGVVNSATRQWESQFTRVGAAFGAMFSLYGAFSGLRAVEAQFSVWEKGLADMGNLTAETTDRIAKRIKSLGPELGSAKELIAGYYQTISAGVKDPAEALDVLAGSAKAAKAAHVSQDEVVRVSTKLMKGYGDQIRGVSDATDLLFAIEKEGQTTVGELVPHMGSMANLSREVGVSVNEMGAALATLTLTAGDTSGAVTQYEAILVSLLKPQEQMRAAIADMGYASGQAMVQELGLAGTIDKVRAYASSSGISIGRLVERKEALVGMAALANKEFSDFNERLANMEQRAGATDRAFARWEKTWNGLKDTFENTIGNILVGFGERLAPSAKSSMHDITLALKDLNEELKTSGNLWNIAGRNIFTPWKSRQYAGNKPGSVSPEFARLLGNATSANPTDADLAKIFGVGITGASQPATPYVPLSDSGRAYSTASAFTSAERRGSNAYSDGGLAELAKANQQEAEKANKEFLDKARQQTQEYVDLVTFHVDQVIEEYKKEQEAIRERNEAWRTGQVEMVNSSIEMSNTQRAIAEAAAEASDDMAAGWAKGMETSTSAILTGFQFAQQSAITFRESLGQGLGQTFNEIRENGINSFTDIGKAALNVANVVASAWLNLLGQQAANGLMGYVSGAMGGSTSTFGAEFATYMASAKGNVFDRSGLVPFARGGVVTRPTVFPFASGVGLMGEAGPEAIMPLRRGADGRLGVEGGGGVTMHQTIQFNGGGGSMSRREMAAFARQIQTSTTTGIREANRRGRRD